MSDLGAPMIATPLLIATPCPKRMPVMLMPLGGSKMIGLSVSILLICDFFRPPKGNEGIAIHSHCLPENPLLEKKD
jgi:hypothetical protein